MALLTVNFKNPSLWSFWITVVSTIFILLQIY